jgi:large repetitive protein
MSLGRLSHHFGRVVFAFLVIFSCLQMSVLPGLAAPCDRKLGHDFVQHDLTSSYCVLCGYGYVTVVITNPYRYTDGVRPIDPDIPGAVMTDIVLSENMGISGLVFDPTAPNPVTYQVNGGISLAGAAPTVSGGGAILTFSQSQIPAFASLDSHPNNNQVNDITLRFAVTRSSDAEGLVSADRRIQATLAFSTDSACADSPQIDMDTLPLREPIPELIKTGWNYDAGQRQSSESNPVYGNTNDDIVWRVRIDNNGLAGMQDLRFDDIMDSGSMLISHVCSSESSANTIAANNGSGSAAGCVAAANNINDFTVSDPFGNMALSFDGYEIDVSAGSSASVYLVGKVSGTGSCETSKLNTVSDVQWGCGEQPPAGGISATSTGIVPTADATFYSRYNDNHDILTVERHLTGTNTAQPVGTNGLMTIIIRNNSAGSVKNILLADLLPEEYVVDASFPPELVVTPAFGADYSGLVDTLTWTNQQIGPLNNIAPEFELTSTTVHPHYADQINMLRQGDVAVIRFRVVLIESAYFDRSANLDVNPEEYAVTATDPTFQTPLTNALSVDFDLFCNTQGTGGHYTLNLNGNGNDSTSEVDVPAFPEDLDIAVGEDVFILTNDPAQILTLPIELTNNGGHDAADYHAFVTFGTTMEVIDAPNGCVPIALNNTTLQPDPWKVWIDPPTLPATATVYECTAPAIISPGQTITYNFDVIKTVDPARIALDDLSLRADVVAEITISDGTPLTFPTPMVRIPGDGELDRANNYSLDATWARVIGFNLKKNQVGTCNENNPPSYDSNSYEEVQIGEECLYRIETGGWFGFQTPGYVYIAVQNIDVVDQLPDGQAYISNTDPYVESTSRIASIGLSPVGLTALTEGWFDWRFNVADADRIEVADEWFVVNTTTRLLNKEIDQRLAPNLHGADSFNVLTSTFDATFSNVNTGLVEVYSLGPNTVGYPIEDVRRVDLTVTEPLLTVIKEVCNETLYGSGPTCSNFVPVADDGDAYSSYIYRLTLSNAETGSGVQHAPAYDVTITDRLDSSDLAYVFPFATDGLNNDGDSNSDVLDANGEGSNSDNIINNAIPAELTFSYLHSVALERIDPGQSVELFYRVDFDNDAAPLQTFTNTAMATYDSMSGDSGSQTISPQLNSTLGGGRVYQSENATADVTILSVVTQPKTVIQLANTPLLGVPGTQNVVVGEELEYQLTTLLPVALLRDFVIRDELPAGLRCAEAVAINLNVAPYSAAGFYPGGTITPSCNDDLVEWNFGNQRLTNGNGSDRFEFSVSFIAQVNNSNIINDGGLISNGHPATVATAEYRDEVDVLINYDYGQVDVAVTEPLIELAQAFNHAVADGADTLTVAVTATNNGTAPAYNLRVLAPLDGTDLSYSGNPAGSDPPDQIDVSTLGADQPIFSWTAPNGIAVGASISFTFDATVADTVQPHQLLETTLEADWTSLPSQSTALNSSGEIAVAGSVNGMRNGTIPNSGDAVNDYETTASASLTVALPSVEKTDQSLVLVPTIGAHKHYQIILNMAEGVTDTVTLSDSLNAAGLSYVLASNAEFDISYSFSGIASINGVNPSESAFNSVPVDGSSGVVSWDIGTVATLTEDDSSRNVIAPAIQIDYYARINNDLDTDAGDQLQNGIEAGYLNITTAAAETLSDDTLSVTVSEPDLSLNKTLANVTDGKDPADAPVAGDIIEYQLTMMNTGSSNSTAFDINIVDSMPAGLVLDSTFIPTATIDSVAVTGFIATPAGSPAGPLVWGRDNGDGSLDVPAGQLLVITYRTLVQVIADPAGLIENGVWSDWTSLADVNSYERTGVGCPTTTAPDDYCVGPVYATTIGIAPELEFQKMVINETTGANPGINASPGDLLRYQIQTTSVSAAAAAYSISDELDRLNTSALFVSGSLTMISVPSGTDSSSPTGGSAGTGLVSVSDLYLDGGDSETIEFTIQLAPVIANGTEVLNQAELMLFGFGTIPSDDPNISGDENPTRTLISSAPAWIFEKTVTDLTGAPSVLFAGDRLSYRISVKNIGSENAIDVVLRDLIPAETTYVAGSTTLNGVVVTDPMAGVSALEVGMSINAPENSTAGVMRADTDVAADNVAIITFDVLVNDATASGTLISNQAFLDGSGEGSGAFVDQPSNDPTTSADADPTDVIVSGISFTKAVDNLTQATDGSSAEPGDLLRYRLTLTNTGTEDLTGLTLTDELEGLQGGDPLYFVPGSVILTSIPTGSDSSASDPSGGGKGTGLVVVSAIDIAAGASVDIDFTVQLAPVITSGSQVLNQAELSADGVSFLRSDSSDSTLVAEEDPTVTLISSAPTFQVRKTSSILSGDPNVLMAGETLRYTIQIKNIGNEDAVDVLLQDYTPSNTVYVAGSVTLNGAVVADVAAGVNPLHGGILVNAPENSTAGFLRADRTNSADNVATITFDVVVNADVMDGLIIENQGFVRGSGAGSGVLPEQPSDDPNTPTVDDPTRNIVGNLPLLYALKTVTIAVDNGSANIVDPGDTLRYTIVISNSGAIPATAVSLVDDVPLNTLYVADSLRLNGQALGADGGVLPLIAGQLISSTDNPGSGIVSAGQSAEITFDVQVAAAVASGTVISNQGTLSSAELADLLTDADGLPANGYQPTLIAVGDVQLLAITMDVAVTDGGSAEPGSELVYTLRVTNIGALPATQVRVNDDLSPPLGDQLAYVSGSATLNGLSTGVSYGANLLSADYSTIYGDLDPGASFVARFNARIDSALAYGSTITNRADLIWNNPQQSASVSVSLDVGGTPDAATLNGDIWHDADLDRLFTATSEVNQQDWSVELYLDGTLVAETTTDASGTYQLAGLIPSAYVSGLYELHFIAPGAGADTASLGYADSIFTNGSQQISAINVTAGSYLQNLNLPLWPNGTIYNSVARTAVAGATVSLLNASSGAVLPDSCFDDPVQQGQVTAANGFYKFDLNFSQTDCSAGASYLIDVVAPANGYLATPSVIIPPITAQSTAAFSVPTCPGSASDAVPATAEYCEAIPSVTAPPLSVVAGSAGTDYYLHLTFADGSVPGQSQIFNNAIPIDPELDGAVAITKTAEITSVTKASQVPYTITLSNIFGAPLDDIRIVDRFPAGFKYIAGSALVDGSKQEPDINGRTLSWDNLHLDFNGKITIRLLLIVSSGVSEGDYVNRAQAYNTLLGSAVSGEASATVRVIPDPDFDCTDVIGKVFDDRNRNGYQDGGESGLAGARVVTARGLTAITDQFGRYHMTCAVVPEEDLGSNFIMKLDDRSLPTGYRVVTENPRVQRATRGKMMRINFGATLHRVVTINIADAVFEPGTTNIRLQWQDKFDQLLDVLKESPALLRLSYLGDVEGESLVEERLKTIKQEMKDRWNAEKREYSLTIETEIFWRRGAPMKKK